MESEFVLLYCPKVYVGQACDMAAVCAHPNVPGR